MNKAIYIRSSLLDYLINSVPYECALYNSNTFPN